MSHKSKETLLHSVHVKLDTNLKHLAWQPTILQSRASTEFRALGLD